MIESLLKEEDLCQKVIENNSVNQYDIDTNHRAKSNVGWCIDH